MAKTNSKEQDQDNTRIVRPVNVVLHVTTVVALVFGLGCLAVLFFLLIWGPTDGGTDWRYFASVGLPFIISLASGAYAIHIHNDRNFKELRLEIREINKKSESQIEAHRVTTEASLEQHRKQAEKARDDFQKQLLALTEKHAKLEGRVMASN